MPSDLTSKPILIAGASAGIGAATAIECARVGMPVALGARRADKLEAVAERCRALGVTAITSACDVTDPDACERFIDHAETQLGPVHAAYANAGYGLESPLLDMPDADVRAMFETNLFGTLNIIRPAAERMKARGSGHLLICSSCLGLFPTPWYSVYSATKSAQHHLGRALDVELRAFGIRCSTVHPIGTKTDFFELMEERQGPATMAGSSERFMQPPEAVARAIVRCLRRPRPEVWTSLPARYGMIASGLAPRLTGFVLRRLIERRSAAQARASSTTA